jgi:pyrroline-5-carboxylate reductase
VKIGIVGTGNMGEAILKGLLDNVLSPNDIVCVDKSQESLDRIAKTYKVDCSLNISGIKDCEVVLLAVKPQNMDEVLPLLGKVISEKTLIISIAVGITSNLIVKNLGIGKAAVVRAMPNTPALVGKGVTGIAKGEFATDAQLTIAKNLLEAVGQVVVVNEDQIDVVAAASGSGPAYYFYVTELLIEAAVSHGLSRDVAQVLVENTFVGSSALFENSDDDVVELRRKVTSPKGTTQAAIEFLESKDLKSIWQNALGAAIKRAEEISKN